MINASEYRAAGSTVKLTFQRHWTRRRTAWRCAKVRQRILFCAGCNIKMIFCSLP